MSGTHARNTGPMRASPRCGARTRNGAPCQAPAVTGKARCRMHGGAKGNQNALKHGQYTAENHMFEQHVRKLLREGKRLIEET